MNFGERARWILSGVLLWSLILPLLLSFFQVNLCSALLSGQKQTDSKTFEINGIQSEVGGATKKSGSAPTSTSNKPGQESSNNNNNSGIKRKPKRLGECEYERGPWEGCQSNGSQRRTLRLKDDGAGRRQPDLSCEPIKTIERECKLVGCKYARGEWSSSCADGKRSRVDTLLGAVGPPSKKAAGDEISSRCPARRTVTKDCRRACHYTKSAWSDCIDGSRTRNLTLDSTLLPGGTTGSDSKRDDGFSSKLAPSGCLKERLIRRQCRSLNKQASTGPSTAGASRQPPGPKMKTTAQKRRLQKQQKLQQLQKAPGTINRASVGGPQERASNGMKRRN